MGGAPPAARILALSERWRRTRCGLLLVDSVGTNGPGRWGS
jgi:hypothetical protein